MNNSSENKGILEMALGGFLARLRPLDEAWRKAASAVISAAPEASFGFQREAAKVASANRISRRYISPL